MKKVSIIVPVYNPKEEFLKECLDNLVSQTLNNIEILVVDNGATGNNSQIIKGYSDKYNNIKLIKLNENKGFSYACNQALKVATGEYIQIVDSDDVLRTDACEKLYEKAKGYNVDMVIFSARMYNQQKGEYEYTETLSLDAIPNKYTQQVFDFNIGYSFIAKTTLQDWNKFVKRELIFDYDNYFEEDLPYILPDCVYSIKNIINAKKIIAEKEYFYDYRVNISSSIIQGFAKEDCTFLDAPVIFAQKLDKIIKANSNNPKIVEFLINIILFHFWQYFNIVSKNNLSRYYNIVRAHLCSLDKNIYKKELLKKSLIYKDIKCFIQLPYLIYELSKKFYTEKHKHGFVYKKFMGILLKREVDIDYIKEQIKKEISVDIAKMVDKKIEELKKDG